MIRSEALRGLPPQANVKRAFAAMRGVGVLETDDKVAEFGQRKPKRYLTAQHARFAAAPAFAGDDQHQPRPARACRMQKPRERGVRLRLREPMQIETCLNRLTAARDSLAI